ncbi:efflux RND transporter permease subunit [Roseibium denhamense]|uniref:Multidrug efflux pump subunit AcrB n=1 Tax=Roseibium denhamense TaxID=76305 RepID=A0ABY1P216_9HYPH|nr:efflux RND transporter permease subunit [Roseibium denhamense]MTI07594.1 efflux RND transporter permease subunit [Roseibium denhamense]SMP24026.1 Multidrug efflux pump subunit AcrB [Roseibium denhamense]
MHALTGWFIRNPVAANLLMLLILFLGLQTLFSIRIEGFPRVPPETVDISVEYPNATAEQVDQLLTQKIEQGLEGLEGVRSITSQSTNGLAILSVRRAGGEDLQAVLDRVRLRIDGLTDLPEQARRPVIETSAFDFPALYVNLYGQADPDTLRTLAQGLKEELLAREELSRLKIWGLLPRNLRIEVDPDRLRQFGLTVADVTDAIQANSLDFQAGRLRTEGGTIFLRADDRALYAPGYAALPIIERPDGSRVLLADLAVIDDGFEEGDFLFRFKGQPTVGMEVLVGQKENLLDISRVVRTVAADFEPQLPRGIHVAIWADSAGYIADRLALLRSNGVQGLLLVLLMLSVFLNVRLALWVAMGIPVAIAGAIAVSGSRWADYSLNDVTTFGLIIALGILVDDAVVVGESVFEERSRTPDPIKGTEAGVQRVAVATVFGVLTTIAAFYPMLLIDNPLGKALAGFSGVVIFALIFSLVESKFILPAHLAQTRIDAGRAHLPARWWGAVQDIAQSGLTWVRDAVYQPVLIWSVRHRYAVLVLFVAAAVGGLGLMIKGKVQTVFFPEVPGQVITVSLEMDARAPFALTRRNIERIEQAGRELNADLKQQAGLDRAPIRTFFTIIESAAGAQIYAELGPVSEREEVAVLDVVRQWRERAGAVEGATELEFSGSEALAGGFQLRLVSRDTGLLRLASNEIRAFLSTIKGVSNIRDSLAGGQPELRLRLRPEARNLGFTAETLASQIGYGFGGAEVTRVRRDGAEVRVVVQNAQAARDTIDDLMQSRLRSKTGAWVPLKTVASVEGAYASGAVVRRDGKRMNIVSASIDRGTAAPEEVAQAVFEDLVPQLSVKYPSVDVIAGGELEEMFEIRGGLVKALILSAVLIYVLMAVPLKSYWQPLVILVIVPFGFVAAAAGHMIIGVPLSLLSFFGMLALTGVIVNDSLVLITRYNQARAEGESVRKALHTAGTRRFRAIFLTTATTAIGLTPLLLETSEQAQYLIPAAVSLTFGELFGTVLMLILVPVLIAVGEDILAVFGRSAETKTAERAVP